MKNESFPVFAQSYDTVYKGFEVEMSGLARVIASDTGRQYLHCFSSDRAPHECYLDKATSRELKKLVKKNQKLDITEKASRFKEVLYLAHLSVCCELLDTITFPEFMLNQAAVENALSAILDKYRNLPEGSVEFDALASKLHSVDAFRTIQILKFLGLLRQPDQETVQLSLGVGSGEKDIRSVFLSPVITRPAIGGFHFSVKPNEFKRVILVDGDPQRESLFNEYNNQDQLNLKAFNITTEIALDKLAASIKDGGESKINRVLALRVDHTMIPDTNEFLKKIRRVIDDEADFIMTMGSGFTVKDFKGRQALLKTLFEMLDKAGMSPVWIKLHGNGDFQQQLDSPGFGLSNMTTYEILYCRINRTRLFAAK